VRGGSARYGAENVLDGAPETYWATDDGVTTATLELAFEEPALCDRIRLEEFLPLGQRVRAFEVEGKCGTEWRPLAQGTTIGARRIVVFPAMELTAVRVRVRDARACPALASVKLFLAPVAFRSG